MTDIAAAEPFAPRLTRHLRALALLAWPVVLSRAGILVMAQVDFAMTGRHSTEALNNLAMGFAVAIPMLVAGVGMMLGVVSLVARRAGAGDADEAARIWARGMSWGVAVSLVAAGVALFTEELLLLFGQAPALAEGGGRVAVALAPGVVAQLLFIVCAFFLEGTGRTGHPLMAMALANVLNFGLNAAMIPAYGAEGAAAASSIARFAALAWVLAAVLRSPGVMAALTAAPWTIWGPGGWSAGRDMRRIGLAGGASHFFETAAFAALTQFAGLIGPAALAAYSIAHSIEALIFMTALGLAVASGVRVGAESGAGRPEEAMFAGWTGLGAAAAMVGLLGVILNAFPEAVGGVYTRDPEIVARVAPLFVILAISLVFDASQIVLAQANRALGDAWPTTFCLVAGFFGVMTPLGWFLGLHTELRETGLFIATALGCLTAAGLLALRFRVLAARS